MLLLSYYLKLYVILANAALSVGLIYTLSKLNLIFEIKSGFYFSSAKLSVGRLRSTILSLFTMLYYLSTAISSLSWLFFD